MPVVAYQIMYIQGGDLETSNLVAHIDSQFFEEKNNTCFTVLQEYYHFILQKNHHTFPVIPSCPNPGQREKINLIFILIQLSEMHGAERVI